MSTKGDGVSENYVKNYVRLSKEDLRRYREATAEVDAARFTAHMDGGRGYVRAYARYWELWEEIFDTYELSAGDEHSIGSITGVIRRVKPEESVTEPLRREPGD